MAVEKLHGDQKGAKPYLKDEEMYAKITGLTDEMDIERGVGHAR